MNANLNQPRPHGAGVVVAAFFAALIAIGILAGVTDLFQSRGTPMAQLAAAERACVGQVYVSERQQCMREWFAAARDDRVARR